MMNVASPELCKKLYTLSGWEYDKGFNGPWFGERFDELVYATWVEGLIPAYTLGHLLRCLPHQSIIVRRVNDFSCRLNSSATDYMTFYSVAGTPEDATAKLAIELFEKGILKREYKS